MNNLLSLEHFNDALEKKGWTMKQLAAEYDRTYPNKKGKTIYNTLRKWNGGNGNPTLEKLVRVCDLLECDIDYLIGRMDEHTHTNQFIHDQTGLSEDAINKLFSFKGKDDRVLSLDFLLLSEDFTETVLPSLYFTAFFEFTLLYASCMAIDEKETPELITLFASINEPCEFYRVFMDDCSTQLSIHELSINRGIVHIADNIRTAAAEKAAVSLESSTGSETFKDSVEAYKEIHGSRTFPDDDV